VSINKVEIVNLALAAEPRAEHWSVKIERGDLRQNGTLYPDMVRRLTLTNLQTNTQTVEVFRGSSCKDKAHKWLGEQTDGAFGTARETAWFWL
jgi:hypothetical protein